MRLPVTMAAAAFLGLLGVALALRVVVLRMRTKVSLGDGAPASFGFGEERGAPALMLAMRAHGNFSEHAPLGLILLGLTELAGAPHPLCVGLALLLAAGRAMHPVGLARPAPNPFRAGGLILTLTEIAGAAAYLIYAEAVG